MKIATIKVSDKRKNDLILREMEFKDALTDLRTATGFPAASAVYMAEMAECLEDGFPMPAQPEGMAAFEYRNLSELFRKVKRLDVRAELDALEASGQLR